MYTGGGGGNSHVTVAKFQYMPGGQGGGGWARLTAGEASSISGRNANTMADTALRCSQGFIGHRPSVAFCMEILDSCAVRGVESAKTVATMVTMVCRTFGVQDLAGSGVQRFAATCRTGRVNRVAMVERDGRVGGVGFADAVALGPAGAEHADAVVVAARRCSRRNTPLTHRVQPP
jgi:hypothetical protein